MQRKHVKWILAAALVLLGAAVIFLPHIRGRQLRECSAQAAESFLEERENGGTKTCVQENYFTELRQEMEQYNERIFAVGQPEMKEPGAFLTCGVDVEAYGVADGVVGVLEIPTIGVELPVLLGATDAHLSLGACVLGQTSMPIGGENTNCVLAGHRGWDSADYFRYLDKLQIGDTVRITNLWETLTYRVAERRIIAPTDSDSILIQPGRDLLTLLTCHPYASGGKQRLVVYCERVKTYTP